MCVRRLCILLSPSSATMYRLPSVMSPRDRTTGIYDQGFHPRLPSLSLSLSLSLSHSLSLDLFLFCSPTFTSEHVPREKRFDERNASNTKRRSVDPHDRSMDEETSFSFFSSSVSAPAHTTERFRETRIRQVGGSKIFYSFDMLEILTGQRWIFQLDQ